MAKTSLPPGFRFHPTDVEIVEFYLKRKVKRKKLPRGVISDFDVYKYAPWDLPEKSCLKSRDLKWYFFCPREKKYASGTRMNRTTQCGYWKTTGKDREILHNNEVAGLKKTLIFHRGCAPKGIRTDWVMHEYRLEDKDVDDNDISQNKLLDDKPDAYVFCMIFQKDGPGPRNGAQYGAPFQECEWDEDDDDANNSVEASPSFGLLSVHPGNVSNDPSTSTAPDVAVRSVKRPRPSNDSCLSGILPSVSNVTTLVPVDDTSPTEQIPNVLHDDDDLLMMLDQFTENDACIPKEINGREVENPSHGVAVELCPDGNDFFNGLGDLANSNPTLLSNNNGHCFYPPVVCSSSDDLYPFDDASFLELMDLTTPIDYDTVGGLELLLDRPCYLATSSGAIPLGNSDQSTMENLQRFDPHINDDLINTSKPSENLLGFSPPLEASNLYGFDCCIDMFEKDNGIG